MPGFTSGDSGGGLDFGEPGYDPELWDPTEFFNGSIGSSVIDTGTTDSTGWWINDLTGFDPSAASSAGNIFSSLQAKLESSLGLSVNQAYYGMLAIVGIGGYLVLKKVLKKI